ncbi:hypothetical protein [Aeromonas veronii]|uniref:hypothetical protein n=1 Tax=Aeromonas veronii TaxID=654 RepID=UPI003F7AC5AF
MSLLAALAKGIGAGTVNNAKAGFDEQQRLREAAQRKEEMTTELTAAEARLQRQLDANRVDTDTRIAAQTEENRKNREHDWAMWERQYAAETAAAVSSADARAREAHAKNIIGTLNEIAKNKSNILSDDKLTDEQRAIAARNNDMLFYSLVSDPAAQQLLGEFGYGGYVQQGMLLAPRQAGGQGGGVTYGDTSGKGGSVTAPPGQVRTPDALRRLPEPAVPMRRFFNDARDGVNTQASAAFSNENLSGVLGEAERRAKINAELQKRARTYQDGALSSNPAMSSFAGMQK